MFYCLVLSNRTRSIIFFLLKKGAGVAAFSDASGSGSGSGLYCLTAPAPAPDEICRLRRLRLRLRTPGCFPFTQFIHRLGSSGDFIHPSSPHVRPSRLHTALLGLSLPTESSFPGAAGPVCLFAAGLFIARHQSDRTISVTYPVRLGPARK